MALLVRLAPGVLQAQQVPLDRQGRLVQLVQSGQQALVAILGLLDLQGHLEHWVLQGQQAQVALQALLVLLARLALQVLVQPALQVQQALQDLAPPAPLAQRVALVQLAQQA